MSSNVFRKGSSMRKSNLLLRVLVLR